MKRFSVFPIVLLIFWLYQCGAASSNTNPEYQSTLFETMPGCQNAFRQGITNSPSIQTLARSITGCGKRCLERPQCESFNFHMADKGHQGGNRACHLFVDSVEYCSELKTEEDWKYLRIPPAPVNPGGDTTSQPPVDSSPCDVCDPPWAGSSWEVAYSISKADGARKETGDKACFTQAIKNGASVRISYKTYVEDSTITRSPIEFVYEQDASTDIKFYFAPLFEDYGLGLVKTYIGVSLFGYYYTATYSASSNALDSESSVEYALEEVSFIVRKAACNEYGGPGNFVSFVTNAMNGLTGLDFSTLNPGLFSPSSLDILNNQASVYTVHSNSHQSFSEVFQANWVLFIGDERIVAIKRNGELYAKGMTVEDLSIVNPLQSEYQMTESNGKKITQLVGLSSYPSTSVIARTAGQVWFADQRWSMTYIEGTGNIVDLINVLFLGNRVRIVFQMENVSYSSRAPRVFCSYSWCAVYLENMPEVEDAGNEFKFKRPNKSPSEFQLQTFQISGDRLFTGDLNSGMFENKMIPPTYYTDTNEYLQIFHATSPETIVLDELKDYLRQGPVLRLVYEANDKMHFLDIDHVIEMDKDTFELHTPHITDRFLGNDLCQDGGKPVHFELVFSNESNLPFKRYVWSWNYSKSCKVEDVAFDTITVFAMNGDKGLGA